MLTNILFALWFFLPAGLSNTTPVIVAKIPFLKNYNYPIDFKKSFRGKRIFGDHKTIRGFITGMIVAVIVSMLEVNIYSNNEFVRSVVRIDYSQINPLILGLLSGFGALSGDAIKSFFKRRAGVQPGKAWIPFDQIDYIIGGILLTLPYIRLELSEYIVVFIVWTILHPFSTVTGYLLKLKSQPI